jgi:hypothetical protein
MNAPKRIDLTPEQLDALLKRVEAGTLQDGDYEIIKGMAETLRFLSQTLDHKNISIKRLLKLIFGESTEKTAKVLQRNKAGGKKTGIIVRVTGNAPCSGKVYELQKLRCNLCQKIFTAAAPEHIGDEKYDAASGAMIALLKYGSGLPFNRLDPLQAALGVALPSSTQWEIVESVADKIHPVYSALMRHAAQGEVVHNDDTVMKVLELMKQSDEDRSGRKGMYTSGILSTVDDRKMAVFMTGRHHAGENLADILQKEVLRYRRPCRCVMHFREICPKILRSSLPTVWPTPGAGLWTWNSTSLKNALMCLRPWRRSTKMMRSPNSKI